MTQISKKLERVPLTDTQIRLVMPERILNQIKYLCRDIAAVEWSGVLFYSIEGTIEDPENMVLTIEDIHPMHKGTASYTEYEFDDSVVEFMMDNETMEKGWKMGHIHSHNTMGVFFSGTDWSELEDNAPNHNFYLSLIVNNFMDFCAKVCFISEAVEQRELAFYSRNEKGEKYLHSSKASSVAEQQLIVYDCNIESPLTHVSVGDTFKERVAAIIKKAEPKTTVTRVYAPGRSIITPTPGSTNSKVKTQEGREWDFGGFPKVPVESREEEKEEEEKIEIRDESITAFAIYVINTGNNTQGYDDVEDVLEYYRPFGLSGNALAQSILAQYSKFYDNFFKDLAKKETADTFVDITEDLIRELEGEVYLSKEQYFNDMLEPVIEGLTRLLKNFEAFEADSVGL